MARKRVVKKPSRRVSDRTSKSRYSTANFTKVEQSSGSNLKSPEKNEIKKPKNVGKPERNMVVVEKSARSKLNSEKILDEKLSVVVKKKNVRTIQKENKTKSAQLKSAEKCVKTADVAEDASKKEKTDLPLLRQSKRINNRKATNEELPKPVKTQVKVVESHSKENTSKLVKEKNDLPVQRQSKRIGERKATKPSGSNEKLPKPVKTQVKVIESHSKEDTSKLVKEKNDLPVQRQSKRIGERKSTKNNKPESLKSVKKQVRIVLESPARKLSEGKIKLRKRKTRNYADKSLELSSSQEMKTDGEEIEKVPIYRRETVKKANKTSKKNPKNDLYEFDSDGEEKNKKRKQHDDDDDEFQPPVEKKPKKSRNVQKNINTKGVVNKKKPVTSKKKETAVVVVNNNNNKSIQMIATDKVMMVSVAAKTPEQPVQTTPQKVVHIINDTVINNSTAEEIEDIFRIETPSSFKFTKPNANSTMLNNVLTPWRFNDINIRRNPHFISIKGSALPNINQEMVIDHTVVEKFDECSKTPRYISNNDNSPPPPSLVKQKSVQKTLPQYFDHSIQNKENVVQNVHQSSLFGNDELSPIKVQGSPVTATKAKRRILADKTNENAETIIHDADADREKSDSNNGNITLFGFDDSSDEERTIQNNKATTTKEAKPFRLSINKADRKYQRKKKIEVNVVVEEEEQVLAVPAAENDGSTSNGEEEEDDNECLNSDEEVPSGEVKLFDDLTPPAIKLRDNEIINYNIKVPVKRKRTKAKKPKDKRTKAEEEAANKWAEAFNSMCQEVDDFELEIE